MAVGFCFAIVDQSTKDPGYGASSAPVWEQMASALTDWLNTDVSSAWGGADIVRYAADGVVNNGEVPCYIVDSDAQVPDAAAYHYRQPNGIPVIYVMLDEFDGWLSGTEPVSSGIGHELAETKCDPGANRWADRVDGSEEAFEVCDRVQATDYTFDSVAVPNFLLPAAFDPGASGPFDKQGVLVTGTAVTPGGYVILRQQGPQVDGAKACRVTLTGNLKGRAMAHKKHHSSRAFRRGWRG